MQLWIFITLFFSIALSSPIEARADDEAIKVDVVVANLDSLSMRILRENERSWIEKSDNGEVEIVITNACGKFKANFNIELSHNNRTRPLKTKGSVGEWCKPPFNLGDSYFFLLRKNEILEKFNLLIDDEGFGVIPMTETELIELETDYEFSRRPIIKPFIRPVYVHDALMIDEETREWIRDHEPNIQIIKDEDGNDAAAYKTGFYLTDLFVKQSDGDE